MAGEPLPPGARGDEGARRGPAASSAPSVSLGSWEVLTRDEAGGADRGLATSRPALSPPWPRPHPSAPPLTGLAAAVGDAAAALASRVLFGSPSSSASHLVSGAARRDRAAWLAEFKREEAAGRVGFGPGRTGAHGERGVGDRAAAVASPSDFTVPTAASSESGDGPPDGDGDDDDVVGGMPGPAVGACLRAGGDPPPRGAGEGRRLNPPLSDPDEIAARDRRREEAWRRMMGPDGGGLARYARARGRRFRRAVARGVPPPVRGLVWILLTGGAGVLRDEPGGYAHLLETMGVEGVGGGLGGADAAADDDSDADAAPREDPVPAPAPTDDAPPTPSVVIEPDDDARFGAPHVLPGAPPAPPHTVVLAAGGVVRGRGAGSKTATTTATAPGASAPAAPAPVDGEGSGDGAPTGSKSGASATASERAKRDPAEAERDAQQISQDVGRTYPDHVYFKRAGGEGQRALFRVLRATALRVPEVGYTQAGGSEERKEGSEGMGASLPPVDAAADAHPLLFPLSFSLYSYLSRHRRAWGSSRAPSSSRRPRKRLMRAWCLS